jgi:hypothetical protein
MIALKIFLTLAAAVASFILYRMGGSDAYNTKWRDMGCPTVLTLLLWCLNGIHWGYWWAYLLSFGLMFGALTTYWNKKGAPERFINFYLHGLGISLALVPYAYVSHHWLGFGLRVALLPLLIGFWATYMNRPVWKFRADVVNEGGRGAWIQLTLPLVLI